MARRRRAGWVTDRHALTDLRQEHGWTKRTLAQLAGVSDSMIGLVERGEADLTPATLARVAGALGVDAALLMEWPDPIAVGE